MNKKKSKPAAKKSAPKKKVAKPRVESPQIKKIAIRKPAVGATKGSSFAAARAAKMDEFYTQLPDIERELSNYRDHFKGKVVYCNCDDPRVSGFVHYFSYNFERLGLKKLVATCYKNQNMDLFSQHDRERAVKLVFTGDKNGSGVPDPSEFEVELLEGDGDFRSPESIELLEQSDIVVTNPPFSLFREYVSQLDKYDKKFIIVGNHNAITYKEIFHHIRNNKMWLGNTSGDMKFRVPDHYAPRETRYWVDEEGNKWRSMGNACWFTNLDYPKRHEDLILYKTYNETNYPKFDYYEAINVNKVSDIPVDYKGVMAVPITFLNKYNPKQFEIMNSNDIRSTNKVPIKVHGLIKDLDAAINGKPTYVRIPIRRRREIV